MFTVKVFGNFDWSEPPLQFADRAAAVGHARGLLGHLSDMGAPDGVAIAVMQADTVEITYSVASWRLAVKYVGDRAYR